MCRDCVLHHEKGICDTNHHGFIEGCTRDPVGSRGHEELLSTVCLGQGPSINTPRGSLATFGVSFTHYQLSNTSGKKSEGKSGKKPGKAMERCG